MRMPATIDVAELEARVQQMYRAVAQNPNGVYHFEMGRALAERLGYLPSMLDQIPIGAIESFAGVGYFFDLAALTEGEKVLDLGSGSGMDSFFAGLQVGRKGRVTGVDMTRAQLDKAEALRAEAGLTGIDFVEGHIEDLPFPDATFDAVISNGVINLSPDKAAVFAEAARCYARAGAWPSPTSSPRPSSPTRSSATPTCGPPASGEPLTRTPTSSASRRPASRWN